MYYIYVQHVPNALPNYYITFNLCFLFILHFIKKTWLSWLSLTFYLNPTKYKLLYCLFYFTNKNPKTPFFYFI